MCLPKAGDGGALAGTGTVQPSAVNKALAAARPTSVVPHSSSSGNCGCIRWQVLAVLSQGNSLHNSVGEPLLSQHNPL